MVLGFAPATNGRKSTAMAMMTMPPPPPTALEQVVVAQQQPVATSNAMQAGAQSYLTMSTASVVDTSSLTVSLQERKPPTPEEIARKKANFNFWYVTFETSLCVLSYYIHLISSSDLFVFDFCFVLDENLIKGSGVVVSLLRLSLLYSTLDLCFGRSKG